MEHITIEAIIKDICSVFNIKIEDFLSKKREASLCSCRLMFYYITIFFDKKRMGVMSISRAVYRNHSSIVKHRKLIKSFLEVGDDHLMQSLNIYKSKSAIYETVNQYYQSKGKIMDYARAFETTHKKRDIK